MMGRTVRTWVTRPRGHGFVLVHRDHWGHVFVVEPSDQTDGDKLEALRRYIATNGLAGDLFYEDGRPFILQKNSVQEEYGLRASDNERLASVETGKPVLLMRRGLV